MWVVVFAFAFTVIHDLGFISRNPNISNISEKDDPICTRLTEWILSNGGQIDGVVCVNRPESGGRGVIASKQLTFQEPYLKLPRHLWFYREWVEANSTIRDIINNDPAVNLACGSGWAHGETCRMILALEYEKHQKNSFFRPYFDTFPERPTSLIWWSEKDLEGLQSQVLLDETKGSWDWINETYDELFPYLTDKYPQHFSPETSTHDSWAISVVHVWARAFSCSSSIQHNGSHSVRRKRKIKATGLMPYADLINHQSYVDGPYSDTYETGKFVVKAAECYKPGAELYHSYGSHHSSHHFLSTYGFIPNGHLKADYISLLIPESATPNKKPLTVAKKGQNVGFVGVDGMIYPEEFLLNFAVSTMPALTSARKFHENYDETATLKSIHAQLEATVDAFPTSLEDDLMEVEQGFKTYESWAALMARVRFKRVFEAAIMALEYRIANDEYEEDAQEWEMIYDSEFETARPSSSTVGMSLYVVHLKNISFQ